MSLIYGVFESPEDAEQRRKDVEQGIVRYHDTTYIEYEIPTALEKELSALIEEKLRAFYNTCQCEDCKEARAKL
jgi:hypothetical protein